MKNEESIMNNVGAESIFAQMKTHNAITLIALIITIIIMLILAGITLNLTLGNNGIFKLAQNAGKNYKEAEKREQEELDKRYKELGLDPLPENTKDTKAGTPVQMPKGWYRETPVKVSDKTGVEVVKTTLIASEEAKKNNIYDLAGNVWEWTESLTQYPVCCRANSTVYRVLMEYGFRSALYIK